MKVDQAFCFVLDIKDQPPVLNIDLIAVFDSFTYDEKCSEKGNCKICEACHCKISHI